MGVGGEGEGTLCPQQIFLWEHQDLKKALDKVKNAYGEKG